MNAHPDRSSPAAAVASAAAWRLLAQKGNDVDPDLSQHRAEADAVVAQIAANSAGARSHCNLMS